MTSPNQPNPGDEVVGTYPNDPPVWPSLSMTWRAWKTLHADLARRGGGHRESGAFLLARPGERQVRAWVAYDDLDPDCLVGNISFHAVGFSRLWALCSQHGLSVIADIHTHPGVGTSQSQTDATHPMIATAGHIALITPFYAAAALPPQQVGVHVLLGSRRWASPPPDQRATVLRLRLPAPPWPRPLRPAGGPSSGTVGAVPAPDTTVLGRRPHHAAPKTSAPRRRDQ